MELFNFFTAYTQLRELYGLELTPDQFETMGMIAWSKIGNRLMTTANAKLDVFDHIVELPCDAHEIEAVTSGVVDFQKTSPTDNSWSMVNELYAEQYIEQTKGDRSNLYTSGKFIKYEILDNNKIKVHQKSGTVNVLYKTHVSDNQGLPKINVKEVDAIACYCAYADTFKKGLMTRDSNMINLSQQLEAKWLKMCDHARTPMSMSQNDFDNIGDSVRSWDRKTYGKSFKPIR